MTPGRKHGFAARGSPLPPPRTARRPELEASYRKLSADLVRRARWKHGLSKEDASDVVQEAFLVGLIKMGSVKNTRAWLERVVDQLAMNLRRTGARRARLMAIWSPHARRTEEDMEEM